MDKLVHITISNKNYDTTVNSEVFSKLMQQLQDAGYFPVITPETINVTSINPEDYKNIVLYRFVDGMEITVQDLVDTVIAKKQSLESEDLSEDMDTIVSEMTKQEVVDKISNLVDKANYEFVNNNVDPFEYISNLNEYIQTNFPDNVELGIQSIITLGDYNPEEVRAGGVLPINIQTNHPKLLACLKESDNATDLTNQEQGPDMVKVVEDYINSINKAIQIVFPDNDELHTKVSLRDDYIEKVTSTGAISYQIDTNHPNVIALWNDIKSKMPEDQTLTVFADILNNMVLESTENNNDE